MQTHQDRDNNYDRVQKAYEAMTEGKGEQAASGPEGIQKSYDNDKTDEFVLPTVVAEDGKAITTIKDGERQKDGPSRDCPTRGSIP